MQKQMFEKAKSLSMLTMGRAEPCTQYFCVVRSLTRRCRAALVTCACACLLAGCAPTFESHIDSPPMPPSDSPHSATQCIVTQKIAPLDPPPCPPGSGLSACFTPEQDAIRQKRFKILHDDRDYCRDAYDRARERAGE
jgi:hypothetical protein